MRKTLVIAAALASFAFVPQAQAHDDRLGVFIVGAVTGAVVGHVLSDHDHDRHVVVRHYDHRPRVVHHHYEPPRRVKEVHHYHGGGRHWDKPKPYRRHRH